MNRPIAAIALAITLAAGAGSAAAWEPQTTHAGLTEQAALSSELHERLRGALGLERGLFEPLTMPPADAEALFEWLRRLDPLQGYVPDARGRMSAVGWLVAGAVIADVPARNAVHHFFDPLTGRGLDGTLEGLGVRFRHRLLSRWAGERLVRGGMPAVEWVTHDANPMNLEGFVDQYGKAIRARTSGERQRHLAGALLAAGALLHVLQDMASPSHVRNDLGAHLQPIGEDRTDVGSRFERLAALAYGRLGVPEPDREVTAPDLRSFFSTDELDGLADRTAHRYFSTNTLPRSMEARRDMGRDALEALLARALRRPHPAPLPDLDLRGAATRRDGVALVDDRGVCLARYRLRNQTLRWHIDDDCALEQIAALLPEAAAYSTGLLDWLFRGTLEVEREVDQLVVTPGVALGEGTIEVFWDDSRGVRTAHGEPAAVESSAAGAAIANISLPPPEAQHVIILYSGVDQTGQPLIATGSLPLQ